MDDRANIDLDDCKPGSKAGFKNKSEAQKILSDDVERLADLHDVFATQQDYALLIVLQGMDTAGKDGIIKHVMCGMNPQGVNVYSFRKPTEEEELHDFLWRESKVLPARGRIAIFNRSYYEEVLVVRVEPDLLKEEAATDGHQVWEHRYEDINCFERHLARCGTIVLKFFLHVSKEEQRERLLARLETPDKMWKASDADLAGHAKWDAYAHAYRQMLEHTNTEWAPWHVIPADRKWVARALVGRKIVETLESLNLHYPELSPERKKRYADLATQLKAE
jgi:PPK2 family polyphosphate:nucleotide phosphotransferase